MKIAQQFASGLVALSAAAGVLAGPAAPSPAAGAKDPLASGRAVYERQCAACHGLKGDGDGPASIWLYPRPRNFSAGLFKIKSTPGASLPTDDDLFQSVTRGLPGSSMPSFSYLTVQERRDAVRYVKYLTAYTDKSGKHVNRFEEAAATGALAAPIEVPPEPAMTVQELTLGQELYKAKACAACHGETGAGDGPSVPDLTDDSGIPIRPRDFNTGLFRGGFRGGDLYMRLNNGLPGTPMMAFDDNVLTPAERWAIVHYIQSLRRTDVSVNDLLAPEGGSIHVLRVKTLPTSPTDNFWESLDPVRVPLNPLWPEPHQVYAVAVSAVTDGRKLAVLLQWRCDLPANSAIRVQDFQDAAAMEFSITGRYGFLGMGDTNDPVNLWQWKAGWQAEVAQGHPPDEQDVYQSMHVDTYFQSDRHFATARESGNVVSRPHKSPIEDANARGFGSFRSQSIEQQNVDGKGVWRAGFWNVVYIRDLKTNDADDVQFAAGKSVPVAFAVWSGEQHDRDGRKMISNWYQLVFGESKSITTNR